MSGWIADPNNEGWFYWAGSDVSQSKNWTQTVGSEPPPGFSPDPGNAGWYLQNGSDPGQQASWWRDETVAVTPEPDAFAIWSAAEIAAMSQCPQANVEQNWPLVFAALQTRGQASPRSCAGAIGTLAIETASTFMPVEEAFWLSPDARLRYYKDTSQHAVYSGGPQFHGRGDIQLTHDYNYRAGGDAIGVDLVSNPDAAMEPQNAAEIFAWYWAGRDIQAMADAENWTAVRRAVQGGTNGLDRLVSVAGGLVASARTRGLA